MPGSPWVQQKCVRTGREYYRNEDTGKISFSLPPDGYRTHEKRAGGVTKSSVADNMTRSPRAEDVSSKPFQKELFGSKTDDVPSVPRSQQAKAILQLWNSVPQEERSHLLLELQSSVPQEERSHLLLELQSSCGITAVKQPSDNGTPTGPAAPATDKAKVAAPEPPGAIVPSSSAVQAKPAPTETKVRSGSHFGCEKRKIVGFLPLTEVCSWTVCLTDLHV
eukprot:2712099-Rhodomonas_salina.1